MARTAVPAMMGDGAPYDQRRSGGRAVRITTSSDERSILRFRVVPVPQLELISSVALRHAPLCWANAGPADVLAAKAISETVGVFAEYGVEARSRQTSQIASADLLVRF